MSDTCVYDKAKYHYDGDFPADLPNEQAFVHTGLFLGWMIEHGLYSIDFEEDAEEDIAAFKQRQLTGTQIYIKWDGVLADDMLSDEGNRFATVYFDFENGTYLEDYQDTFSDAPTLYHVEDTWDNYFQLKEVIDQRFMDWKNTNAK
ncbi:hypothetical protein M3650_11910 [Paenibacillus sp. MER TA 81-3]|uniref:DUF7832 domain-containing protein n=1 Tax=Paenibacillus sp. MER TA 81-3 TaxID=2939573 RepID=UPI00203B58C2|nr:hypothetical protein [Paenibacillus sp. MER TA 81-3]MCM3339323.1 hypothetical protein [Paenibacillus sp. MER TA 81-3]